MSAAVAGMLLAGCSYAVKEVENPVRMPLAWDSAITPEAVQSVPREWWRNFNSPVLNELIERALVDSPTLIAAEERLKQAERNFARSRDDLFPDLSLSASTRRTYTGGNQQPENTSDSTSLGLSSSYSVDMFGIAAARYRVQAANFIGTKYDTDLARITLAQNVARAYFNLLGVRSQVNVARTNLAIAEELLRIQEARRRAGVTRQFDLTQQTTQVLQQRTNLIPLENQMRAAETALGLLLGVTPQEFRLEGEPIEQLTVPEIAPWVPSELLLRRPDLAAAELDMANASANLYIARASLIPVTLSLSASGNAGGSPELFQLTDARNFSVGGVLSLAESIFNFRQKRTNILNAESNEYIALVQYAQTIRQALKDVDDTLATAEANLRAEESQQRTLAQSQTAFGLAEIELREGSGSQQELLDSQRSLFSAQDSLLRSRLTRLNTAVSLYVALGGGWSSPEP
ncbi:MAG TPA: efflux transporter outer membrane subunit [Steroidobacteraceae bacterium]|nr:efflux transporter outer membrane subunit [Steroidobacteraceae bacterium]